MISACRREKRREERNEPAHQTLENANSLFQLLDVDRVRVATDTGDAEHRAADFSLLNAASRSENGTDEKDLEELFLILAEVELGTERVEFGGDGIVVVRGAGREMVDDGVAENSRLELARGFRLSFPATGGNEGEKGGGKGGKEERERGRREPLVERKRERGGVAGDMRICEAGRVSSKEEIEEREGSAPRKPHAQTARLTTSVDRICSGNSPSPPTSHGRATCTTRGWGEPHLANPPSSPFPASRLLCRSLDPLES
jgi:hypothetical protein